MEQNHKKRAVFEAATKVFSQYGFKRTSMADIAEAAGMSRPALYVMFENKEDLFRHLANYRQSQAIDEAVIELDGDDPIAQRLPEAILAYERVFYEPIAASPHGDEFLDISQSIASQDMMKGRAKLIEHLQCALNAAANAGEITFSNPNAHPEAFVELLFSSINGQKKAASSYDDFKKRIVSLTAIFMQSVASDNGDV